MATELQRSYLALVRRAARRTRRSPDDLLREIAERSARINRYARLTGDASTYAAARLARRRRSLGPERLTRVVARFVEEQAPRPGESSGPRRLGADDPDVRRALDGLLALAEECRHGL